MPGFNCELPDDDKANDAYWQPWEINKDLFDCMREYYNMVNKDNVKTCELGGQCESDEE